MTNEIIEYTGFSFPALVKQYDIDLSSYTDRQKIEIMEWALLDNFDNVAQELPVEDFIHDGMYYRALTIPAGVCLTGKIHHDDHICILEKGDLSVMTDDGMKRLQAPARFKARAGLKKIGYAHTDVIFSTVHRTDAKTCQEAEQKHFSDSDLSWVDDIMDYQFFLTERGITEKQVYEISSNKNDVIEDPEYQLNFEIKESKLKGLGLFSLFDIEKNTAIGLARIGDKRTIFGRYINHSKKPNIGFTMIKNGDVKAITLHKIAAGDELTINYREAIKCHV